MYDWLYAINPLMAGQLKLHGRNHQNGASLTAPVSVPPAQ
uniref:Uncharacterized protein n=1 Tax=Caenorhabditis japonica TaxID=281687 RepID=A0A8R1EHT7_CAEJA